VRITHVSADAAEWIARVVDAYCPTVVRCADPLPVRNWAIEALDEVRRTASNDAGRATAASTAPALPAR
jgi:transposase